MAFVRICPVCGQKKAKVLFRPSASPGPVSKCQFCGMVYIASIENSHSLIFDGPVTFGRTDPKVLTSTNLDDVKGSWEFQLLPDKEVEWPALRQNAIEALQRIELHISGPRTERQILDFGSGWGFFLAVAKEYGWKTYGLEPLPASSVYARATFGLNIVTDTLHEDTFPQNCFDAITSFQVFEHLPSPRDDLLHLARSLRRNGIVFIEVPNFETWTMKIMASRHRHFVQDHLNFFSMETLSELLTTSGFRVVDKFHTTRRMSVRHLIQRWLRRYIPSYLADTLQGSLKRSNLWKRTVGLNIGDIITVVARKL